MLLSAAYEPFSYYVDNNILHYFQTQCHSRCPRVKPTPPANRWESDSSSLKCFEQNFTHESPFTKKVKIRAQSSPLLFKNQTLQTATHPRRYPLFWCLDAQKSGQRAIVRKGVCASSEMSSIICNLCCFPVGWVDVMSR